MAMILDDVSRTFKEFLLLPRLTEKGHTASNVSLKTPLARFRPGKDEPVSLNVPVVSAAMQAVSGAELAIALARKGGCSFVFCSQSVDAQAAMVKRVKDHKAGFVESDSNLSPDNSLKDAVELTKRTGHSTIAITEGGKSNSKLLGILTSKDFWEFKDDLSDKISQHFTPLEKLVLAHEGVTLQEATEILWKKKKECLPIIDKKGNLKYLVFRKDYFDHKSNPDELLDADKRLFVGAALNTHDFKARAKAALDAGADVLCLDSSDGYSEWQAEACRWIKKECGSSVLVGGGNIVTAEAFRYMVKEAGVDFVKVGIGGGSICITREQKGLGRGQASAVLDIVAERDRYLEETGYYVPVCSDGGLNNDTEIIIALAMGADFVMMGKYFTMTEESPTEKITYRGRLYKPYWGEGSSRAKNWERYKQSERPELLFEEGVDAYVPYSGSLGAKMDVTTAKLKSTMCNCGATTIKAFHENAILTRVSEMTIVEGGTSNVEQLDRVHRDV